MAHEKSRKQQALPIIAPSKLLVSNFDLLFGFCKEETLGSMPMMSVRELKTLEAWLGQTTFKLDQINDNSYPREKIRLCTPNVTYGIGIFRNILSAGFDADLREDNPTNYSLVDRLKKSTNLRE